MIGSEEKKKRLLDTVTHWCEFTKIKPYLRDYDISSLVSQIVDEFYWITLTCGHKVNDIGEGVNLKFKEIINGEINEVHGLYCKDCAEQYIKELDAEKQGED